MELHWYIDMQETKSKFTFKQELQDEALYICHLLLLQATFLTHALHRQLSFGSPAFSLSLLAHVGDAAVAKEVELLLSPRLPHTQGLRFFSKDMFLFFQEILPTVIIVMYW